MKQYTWSVCALLCIMSCHVVLSSPLVKRQADLTDLSHLNPTFQDGEVVDDNADRDKRKADIFKLGIKSAVLGAVFGKINSFIDHKTRLIGVLDQTNIAKNAAYGIQAPSNNLNQLTGAISASKFGFFPVSTTPAGPTTTDDTPDFDRQRVSLVIPDELFGSSFQLVTNLSKIVGDVILGTAQRTQRLLEALRPFFSNFLIFKGLNVQALAEETTPNAVR